MNRRIPIGIDPRVWGRLRRAFLAHSYWRLQKSGCSETNS